MSDPKQPYIGGQAVIEGVMMRAPGCMSVAVRRHDGAIVVREGPLVSSFDHKPWKWPGKVDFFRTLPRNSNSH